MPLVNGRFTLEEPEIPEGATVYTHQLAGASLDELLDAASRDWWPNSQCVAEWALLRAWAAAEESLRADEAEARAWAATMRDLNARRLPYEEWVSERQAALEDRLRGRKLQQTRIRYRYGFKQPRRWRLIARDVRALCQQASVSMRDARVP